MLNFMDRCIVSFDNSLKTLLKQHTAKRLNPAHSISEAELSAEESKKVQALIRIDHVGEVCAQALYQGQAFLSRSPVIQNSLLQAAEEEVDHLVWCEERLKELGGRTSFLNPAWYILSFSIGMLAAVISDRYSMGFLAETERQVVEHLDSHLAQIPKTDIKTKRILDQMKIDEERHATKAIENGSNELPKAIQSIMRICSKMMTTTAYWI
ncbi:MAG: 2-polyprenyl-3-methyl-6-methoxy-1,4-benzoquinone monooxygenase [Gammaproteobacteria bacterium]